MDRWIYGQIDRKTDGQMDRQMDRREREADGLTEQGLHHKNEF
jgi:hypothetical protein